jgi:hypothetical protein
VQVYCNKISSAWHLHGIILYHKFLKILRQILHVYLDSDIWVRFTEQMPLVHAFKTNVIIANVTRSNASRSKDSSQPMKLKISRMEIVPLCKYDVTAWQVHGTYMV